MHTSIKSAEDVVDFSVKMVPDGHFDQVETERRRKLWRLWVVLPQQYHQHYPRILAERFQRPVEWVREVLNLTAPDSIPGAKKPPIGPGGKIDGRPL